MVPLVAFVTSVEAAEILGCTREQVTHMIRQGRLCAFMHGTRWRVMLWQIVVMATYLKTNVVAEMLGFTRNTIASKVRHGHFKCVKIGRIIYIDPKEVDRYVERRKSRKRA